MIVYNVVILKGAAEAPENHLCRTLEEAKVVMRQEAPDVDEDKLVPDVFINTPTGAMRLNWSEVPDPE